MSKYAGALRGVSFWLALQPGAHQNLYTTKPCDTERMVQVMSDQQKSCGEVIYVACSRLPNPGVLATCNCQSRLT